MDRWEAELLIKTLAGGEDPDTGDTIIRGTKEWHFGPSVGGCDEYVDIGEVDHAAELEIDFSQSKNIICTLLGDVHLKTPLNVQNGCTYHVLFVMDSTVVSRAFSWSNFWYWPDGVATLSLEGGDLDLVWATCTGTKMLCFLVKNLHTMGLAPGEMSFAGYIPAKTLVAALTNLSGGVLTFAGTIPMQGLAASLTFTDAGGKVVGDGIAASGYIDVVDKEFDIQTRTGYATFVEGISQSIPVMPLYGDLNPAKLAIKAAKLPAGVLKDIINPAGYVSYTDLEPEQAVIVVGEAQFTELIPPRQETVNAFSVWFVGTIPTKTLSAGLTYSDPIPSRSVEFVGTIPAQTLSATLDSDVLFEPPSNIDAYWYDNVTNVAWANSRSGVRTQLWYSTTIDGAYNYIDTTGVDEIIYTHIAVPVGLWYKLRHEDATNPAWVSDFSDPVQSYT